MQALQTFRNGFNRLFMLVLSFVSFGFGIVVLLLLGRWISPAEVSPNGTIMFDQWNFFAQSRVFNPLLGIIVGGVCAFAGLVGFIFQALPRKRESSVLVVRHDSQGKVTMDRSSVRDLVQYEVASMPDVIETHQDVKMRRDGLHVHVRSSLAPGTDANRVGRELQEKLRSSLQQRVGVPVANIAVETQFAPLNRHSRRRVR